jgi:protein-tyrosine phosphatase
MSLVGVKVFDGLFLGDASSAEDLDSIQACKVGRVVNCCAGEVANQWESMGIKYLAYHWEDTGSQTILDKGDFVVNDVFDFIEKALAAEEGVLIHSLLGQQRSCCILAAYLMKKFTWSLKKTKEYLKYRELGIELKMGFLQQLQSFEKRLLAECKATELSQSWSNDGDVVLNAGEVLLMNTFLNVKACSETAESMKDSTTASSCTSSSRASSRRASWADAVADGQLVEEQEPEAPKSPLSMMLAGSREMPKPVKPHGPLKSALKGASSPTVAQIITESSESVVQVEEDRGRQVLEGETLAIQTRSRVITCNSVEIVPKRFGLKIGQRCIVLEYEVPVHGLRAHHAMKVCLTNKCDRESALRLQREHPQWLHDVSLDQLAELVGRLRRGQSKAGGC